MASDDRGEGEEASARAIMAIPPFSTAHLQSQGKIYARDSAKSRGGPIMRQSDAISVAEIRSE